MSDEQTTVSYSVKELLARLDQKMDGILLSLDAKAEKEHVRLLEARVKIVEDALTGVHAVSKYKRWLIGLSISMAGVGVAVIGLLVSRL